MIFDAKCETFATTFRPLALPLSFFAHTSLASLLGLRSIAFYCIFTPSTTNAHHLSEFRMWDFVFIVALRHKIIHNDFQITHNKTNMDTCNFI